MSSDLTDGESNGISAAYVVKLRLNQARQDTNSKGESWNGVYMFFLTHNFFKWTSIYVSIRLVVGDGGFKMIYVWHNP